MATIEATVLSEGERVVLGRIARHPNSARTWSNSVNDGRKRYYLAHAPGAPWAVLRLKDSAGLEEWRSREWTLFQEPPTISDVTLQALELIEYCLDVPLDQIRFADVSALLENPPVRLVLNIRGKSDPPPGAIPLWQIAPDDRHTLPISHFRNDCGRPGTLSLWRPGQEEETDVVPAGSGSQS